MKNPRITVLMPVFNAEKFLKEAIDSILNQTFKDFEFLIINDASTDRSKEIILSYKDQRIRYFENKKNLGQAVTLNRGLRLARGGLIARMDADDISYRNRLELQYQNMQRDKEIIVSASFYDVVDKNGNFLYQEKYTRLPEEIYYTLQFRNCLGHPTVMFRKYIILDIFDGYDEEHESEDYDLWLRISSKYKISKINTCLLNLRVSRNSRMGATGKKLDDDSIFLAKKNLTFLTHKKISLNTIEILRRNFSAYRSSVSINFSPAQIRKAVIFLEDINSEILVNFPTFLSKSVLGKITTQKLNSLKHDLFLAKVFEIKFGHILMFLFKVYFFIKRKLVLKFYQLSHF